MANGADRCVHTFGRRLAVPTQDGVLTLTVIGSSSPDRLVLRGDKLDGLALSNTPYPYEEGGAERWMLEGFEKYEKGALYFFAIAGRPAGELVGTISLAVDERTKSAELGY